MTPAIAWNLGLWRGQNLVPRDVPLHPDVLKAENLRAYQEAYAYGRALRLIPARAIVNFVPKLP